jgi:hypothetical protein
MSGDEIDQATLNEYGAAADDEAVSEGEPTPAENAQQIECLVDLVETLNDQVTTLVDEVGQHDTPSSIDTKPTDDERMFQ